MFSYILFDLDGTISDPEAGITKSVQYALDSFGIHEPDTTKLRPFIGPPLRDSFMEFYGFTAEQAEVAVAKYRERFSVTGLYENTLYPGMRELLRDLRQAGAHLGIASSKPSVYVEEILNYFEIRQYFEVVVGSELSGQREKKAEVLEETLRRFGSFDRSQAVLVGDRKYDIEGAKAAGIHQIGVEYGFAQPGELSGAGAEIVVRDVDGLRRVLLGQRTVYAGAWSGGYASRVRTPQKESRVRTVLKAVGSSALAMWLYFIIGVLVPMAFLFIGGMLFPFPIKGFDSSMDAWLNLGSAAGIVIAFLACYGIWHSQLRFRSAVRVDKLSLLPLAIFSASLAMGMNGLLSLVELYRYSPAFQEVSEMQSSVPVWFGVLSYGILAPLGEETVFRGVVYGQFKKACGVPAAMVLSAILFGLFHGNLVQFVYAAVLGLGLALVREIYDSLLASMFFHMVANLFVYFLLDLTPIGGAFVSWISCVFFLVVSVVSLILMVRWQKQ